MMEEIYIYGCGGVGNEIAELLRDNEQYKIRGFIDDNSEIRECMGYQCWTLEEKLKEKADFVVIVSNGEPMIRETISKKLEKEGIKEIILDLSEHHAKDCTAIATGSLLHYGSYISTNTTIGKCCMINKYAIVGHDCTIGNYCVLSPRVTLGGDITIGDNTYIGTGALIRNGIKIGKNAIVGMGAVVTKNVGDYDVVVGNPARFLRKNESGRVFAHK